MENLYPDNFIYKIIFRKAQFTQENFIKILVEEKFLESYDDFSIVESSKGKYVSLTFDIFIDTEDRADILNKLIYAQSGIVNYYSIVNPGEKNGND